LEGVLAHMKGSLTAWSHGAHPGAEQLAAQHGFVRARSLWVMRRSLAHPLPDLLVPEGVLLTTYSDHWQKQLLAVNAAAFSWHHEQGTMDTENLSRRMQQNWFDPKGLILAVDSVSQTLVGFHWTKQHDATQGEVYVIGVSPQAQGRGLGKVLLIAGLRHLLKLGLSKVLLYVESDNTAAIRAYLALGFYHANQDTHVQYLRKELSH
jgi:mycothiol synthase